MYTILQNIRWEYIPWGKNHEGEDRVHKGMLLFYTVIREGLTDKETFGLRPRGSEEMSQVEF